MFTEAASTLKEYLEISVFIAEKGYAMRILSKCEPEQAEEWLMKSVEIFPSREALLALANHYYLNGEWAECVLVSKEALKVKQKPTEFLSEAWAWGHMADDLIAVCSWQLGDFKTAYKHGKIAAEMSPNDERLIKNLEFYKEKVGNANIQRNGRHRKK
jgi:tetratricopeptide (TPR) repeat protein